MSRFDLSVLETARKVPGVPRHKTREVRVGNLAVGGSNPVWVQSMTTTDTFDVEGTVKQVHALEEAGCQDDRILRHLRTKMEHTSRCWVLLRLQAANRPHTH